MKLVLLVLRVDPARLEAFDEIARRLREETGDDYPISAIVRALLALAGRETIADVFAGHRSARGRRRADGVCTLREQLPDRVTLRQHGHMLPYRNRLF